MVYIFGEMEENIKDNILWTRNKGMEFMCGLMENRMMDIGIMGNSMVKENIFQKMGHIEKGYG